MAMNCENCGSPLKRERSDFDYTLLAGLDPAQHEVVLCDVDTIKCDCGESPEIPNIDGLHYTIGLSLIRDESPLDGSAVRFLRKTLGETQAVFAEATSITTVYLSEWENGHKLPAKSRRVLAALHFLDHLLHREQAEHISLELVRDTVGRMAARTRETREAHKLEVDFETSPPAWMIAEFRKGDGHVGGGL